MMQCHREGDRLATYLHESVFVIADRAQSETVIAALKQAFKVQTNRITPDTVTFFDTFDWGIYRSRTCLASECNQGIDQIVWSPQPEATHRCPLNGFKSWTCGRPVESFVVDDLPTGPFRGLLRGVTGNRRLLPIVNVSAERQRLNILDELDKTIARVRVEIGSAESTTSDSVVKVPFNIVRLTPIRGYPGAARKINRFLQTQMALVKLRSGLYPHAVSAIGRYPGDYTSKFEIDLNGSMSVLDAAWAVQKTLLQDLEANEDGTRQHLDSEFLHDFRVAIRRTRTAMSQLKQVLPPDHVSQLSNELRWLGRLTGPTRDLDVHLEMVASYCRDFPKETGIHLAPMISYMKELQCEAQSDLARQLDSARYLNLKTLWRKQISQGSQGSSIQSNADRPVREVVSERIWKVYRRLLHNGGMITPSSHPERLHDLRKEAKKLRYLIEFFSSLYPEKLMTRATRVLKQLQTNLGNFNDFEVQHTTIRRIAEELMTARACGSSTILAMGALLEYLSAGQSDTRREFGKCFARFSTAKNQGMFRHLFRKGESS